jgi:hypothetical protein
MIKDDKYIGELNGFKVYKKLFIDYYYAVDETGKFVISGDSYCEVFDELAYIILERLCKEG